MAEPQAKDEDEAEVMTHKAFDAEAWFASGDASDDERSDPFDPEGWLMTGHLRPKPRAGEAFGVKSRPSSGGVMMRLPPAVMHFGAPPNSKCPLVRKCRSQHFSNSTLFRR